MALNDALIQHYKKALLKSQQGELDAVIMYRKLALVAEKKGLERDAKAFRQLSKDEARHAAVFQAYTKKHLKAKHTKARALAALFHTVGRERLYPMIAKGEYDAAKSYDHLVERFPEVRSVLADENRHGDTVMALLSK